MKSKQTITFFARILPPNPGGVERHLENISPHLEKLGYAVQLVGHDVSNETSSKNRLVMPSSIEGNKFLTWRWILNNRHKFGDILHSHDVHWWLIPLFLLPNRPKMFGTYHGYHSLTRPEIKEKVTRALIHRQLSGSMSVGRWIDEWYGTRSSMYMYGGADYKRISLPNQHSACFIGRLEQDTAILEYLDLAENVGPSLPLSVYGDGSLLYVVQRYQSRSPWIQYKGVTQKPQLVLQRHSILFASQYLSMIEGLQMGRLVVSIPNSELKQQYLNSFPGIKHTVCRSSISESKDELKREIDGSMQAFQKRRTTGVDWALKQQWNSIADQYHTLWTKVKK